MWMRQTNSSLFLKLGSLLTHAPDPGRRLASGNLHSRQLMNMLDEGHRGEVLREIKIRTFFQKDLCS